MIREYLWRNKVYALALAYFLVGAGLKMAFSVNILPPCLSVLLLDVQCPGCGITRACIALLSFDFQAAWNLNKLVFFIIPVFLITGIRDFLRFRVYYRNKE